MDPYFSDFQKQPKEEPEPEISTRFKDSTPVEVDDAVKSLHGIIGKKNEEEFDAVRGWDSEMEAHHKEEAEALTRLLEKIRQGRWSEIDLENEDEFSVNSWLETAESSLKSAENARVSKKRINFLKRQVLAWKKIRALIKQRQA